MLNQVAIITIIGDKMQTIKVPGRNNKHKILVYAISTCGWCKRARQFLKDNNVEYEYIGKETSEDLQAIWCYLEIINIESIKSIRVENSLLMELFDDQKNIIHIMMPDKKQGYFMLEKGKSSDKATFK